MNTLGNIVNRQVADSPAGPSDWNPFINGDLLQECSLIEIRSDLIESRVATIVDLRTGLGDEGGNTGILVVNEVNAITWTGRTSSGNPMMRTIIGLRSELEADALTIRFDLTPKSHLLISGVGARYYEGIVPGLSDAQPDLGEAEYRSVVGGFADWDSAFDVLYSFELGPCG